MPAEADLVAYLDPLVSETAGINLFEGPMPEAPDNCVALTHYGSQRSDDYVMSASLSAPGSELVDVQLMVRNTVKATAIARAAAYHALLDNLQSVTIAGRSYFAIESDGEPYSLGQDLNYRWRYISNYHIRKARG